MSSATTSLLRWSFSRSAAMVFKRPAWGEAFLRSSADASVLEELLLPEVEERGRELVLVAEVGHGDAVDQVPPEDGDLLRGRVVLAGLSHGRNSCRDLP